MNAQPTSTCPHRNWWATLGTARCTDCGATWAHPKNDPPPAPLAPVIPITRGPRRG